MILLFYQFYHFKRFESPMTTVVVTISHGRRASQNFIIQNFLNSKESSSSNLPDLHEFKTVFRIALSITVQKLWAIKVLNTVLSI